jgi:peptidoglycan/xylan/chitin deacetylase (PgdA/CDA1 family)
LDLTQHDLGSYALSTLEERKSAIGELLKKTKHLPYERRLAITQTINKNLGVEINKDIMLTTGQVRGLYENGMEIGAHTDTHPILTKVENDIAFAEIEKSKNVLENMLGSKVNLFAYPNGKPNQDYNQQHVSMVRDFGFDAAVSTEWGVSSKNSDLYQLPRFTPWDKTQARFMIRLLKNYFH